MIPRFRRLLKFAPGFLNNPDGDGERIMFSIGKLCDAFAEKMLRGLEARFPTRTVASANALTAGDRMLLKGRSETNAAFAQRLIEWRNPRGHKVRGNAYEVLLQIWYYWGGIDASTVDSHGNRHTILATDTPDVDALPDPDVLSTWTETIVFPADIICNWDDVSAETHWSRFWIILKPTVAQAIAEQPDLGDPALWGGALGTPGYTLGQTNVTSDDVLSMRALFQELKWNPGHTQPEWLILDIAGTGDPEPESAWKYWSKDDGSGTRIRARSTNFRYWSLAPEYNNTYGGSRAREWPNAARNVDGSGTYSGDRTNGAAFDPQTLPNGETYFANHRWPNRVLLVDDGSIPK